MNLPKSERLRYRLLSRSQEDKDLIRLLDTNPKNKEFFPDGASSKEDIPKIIERFVGGYEKYNTPIFMVFDNENNFIGRAGFGYAEEIDAIEIGYVIDHKYWGKGYATEVVKALLTWAKENLEYNEVFAFTGVDHLASIAVMKKNSMEYVGKQILKGIECVLYKKEII
ncbi:GNAT family N-acetyltransferase [Candidatus Francisella endociliophora]|uniref:GNAT family N-acetyltransferase n=1 Tax=Candidatus Francisella endociliophora TaxID=653937 RepID=UPI000694E1FF|nr:GNAT family N-acetyltransferase [Francisella sp. FSC1006]